MEDSLTEALERLRDTLAPIRFTLNTSESEGQRAHLHAVIEQMDDYLLPRARCLEAPLLAVVGGSTGAGKSTLVNSLVGQDVSPAGVLRPTTRNPVLVCSPSDRDWFTGEHVLASLARTSAAGTAPGAMRIVVVGDLPPGLALLDAPDVDSVVESNRELAARLLAAADLWMFLTTASRYADAVPWDLLRAARDRATVLAVVLNRVPPEARSEVEGHLRAMLADEGLRDARVFVIEERPLLEGRLPGDAVAPVNEWIGELTRDAAARASVIHQTLVGALGSLGQRVGGVLRALTAQEQAALELRRAVEAGYARSRDEVEQGIRSGTLLRGEVLARWHDFVGTGAWTRSLEAHVGRLRDRLTAVLTRRPAPAERLEGAVKSNLETLLLEAAEQAAERGVASWRSLPGGPGLLAGRELELDRASGSFAERTAFEIREWQGFIQHLVRTESAGRRAAARFVSFGVNGVGLVVMLAVFAQTGGLTGGEVAIAGGTSAVGQRLLGAILGDAAVRALAARAREDLLQRVDRLLLEERERFDALVASASPPEGAASALRVALADVSSARRAVRM